MHSGLQKHIRTHDAHYTTVNCGLLVAVRSLHLMPIVSNGVARIFVWGGSPGTFSVNRDLRSSTRFGGGGGSSTIFRAPRKPTGFGGGGGG